MSDILLQLLHKMTEVKYIVAVSGGVDSVVLLDMLSQEQTGPGLLVAHFDHGIRPDSREDRLFVERLAQRYGLPFESAEGRLGAEASEAAARRARYDFLRAVQAKHGARLIVTAHHGDDLLETAVLNILRGTGRKGLSSLRSTDDIHRPLLNMSKSEIHDYARRRGLEWREDSTNQDRKYLRNYIRHELLTRLDETALHRLRLLIHEAHSRNAEIDQLLAELLAGQPARRLDRQWFIMLPHAVAREIMAAWLRQAGVANFDRKLLERLVVAGKTYLPGKRVDVDRTWVVAVGKDDLALTQR